jgi:hypothetical protein
LATFALSRSVVANTQAKKVRAFAAPPTAQKKNLKNEVKPLLGGKSKKRLVLTI